MTPSASIRPTFVRYQVLAMLFLLSIITYLDRVCISSAAPDMMRDLGLTPQQMGQILGAFYLAYGIFEIPGGWMGDRFGPKKTLTRIVIWWSFFTALTGRVSSYQILWVTRFLFGAGEAGAYPNSSAAIARWFPFVERARAHGLIWMASRIGGALAPLIVVPLLRSFGWRAVFYLFGGLGIVWAAVWYYWYRDTPDQKPTVNAAELAVIREGAAPLSHSGTPWGTLLASGNLWAVTFMYFTYGYGVNFYFTWLPTYLKQERGIENFAAYASLPFFLGAIANGVGGWASDHLVRRLGLRWGRRIVGLIGIGSSVLFVLASLNINNLAIAVTCLAMGFAATDFMLPNCWAVCLDIGKRYAGTVTGFMNTGAQISGFVAANVFGYYVGLKQWNTAIYIMAAMLALSFLMWLIIDASKPLVRDALAPEVL